MMPTESLTKLKIRLLEEDMPAYAIAARCGMHPYILSQYATGQRSITRKHLRALTRYFHCRQDELIGWEEISWDDD
jgi:transcriptional regulator with XRE-family HTH domain